MRDAARRVRRRRDQGGAAARRRRPAASGPAGRTVGRRLLLVVRRGAQQEVDHVQPERSRRAGADPPAGGGGARGHRELPPRDARALESRLGRALADPAVPRDGSHLGVRPDRPEPRASGLRADRRRGRRPRVPRGLPGPRAGLTGNAHRPRLSGRCVRRRRRARGVAPRRANRRGSGGRPRLVRARAARARRRDRRVRWHRPGARADRLGHGERGAAQPLSDPRRALDRDRLHQRSDVRAAESGHGAARPARRSADDHDTGAARASNAGRRARRRMGGRA